MKRLLLLMLVALLASCDNSPPPSPPAVAVKIEAPPASPASAPSNPADDSELEKLIPIAIEQRKLAVSLKARLDAACLVDNNEGWAIVRSASAAARTWEGLHASDCQKMERSACLSLLSDVSSAASNCLGKNYDTALAAQKDRHYAEDLKFCDDLLTKPPPLAAGCSLQ